MKRDLAGLVRVCVSSGESDCVSSLPRCFLVHTMDEVSHNLGLLYGYQRHFSPTL